MVTSISGIISFRFTARKKPAAPPPIIAVRFAIVFVHSLLIIITMSEELSHR
jgi:hypothetical protein